jgi:hypothetical protein
VYRIEARTGTTPLKAVTLSADCNVAAGDYWKVASSSCQFDTTQPPTVTLTSDKRIIRSGESASLHWSFQSVLSAANCTLSGPNVKSGYMSDTTKVASTSSSGDYNTGALSSYSTFMFTCQNGVLTSSASVSIEVVPTVIEN